MVRSETFCPSRMTVPAGTSRFSAPSFSATTLSGSAERLEPARIEIHLDLAHVPAVDLHGGDAVDLLDERLQLVLDLAARHVGRLRRADGERS